VRPTSCAVKDSCGDFSIGHIPGVSGQSRTRHAGVAGTANSIAFGSGCLCKAQDVHEATIADPVAWAIDFAFECAPQREGLLSAAPNAYRSKAGRETPQSKFKRLIGWETTMLLPSISILLTVPLPRKSVAKGNRLPKDTVWPGGVMKIWNSGNSCWGARSNNS